MGIVTKLYKVKNMSKHGDSILDTVTGEITNIEKSAGLFSKKMTGDISISSKNYVYLDTDKLTILLKKGIKQVDLAILISITSNLLAKYNVCMLDDKSAHRASTIAILTESTQQSVKVKLKRLETLGLLFHGILKDKKSLGKVYVVNPHLLRKGHDQCGTLRVLFDDIL